MNKQSLIKAIGPLIFLILLLTGVGSLARLNTLSQERAAEIAQQKKQEEKERLDKQNTLALQHQEELKKDPLEEAFTDFNANNEEQVKEIQKLSKELFHDDYLAQRSRLRLLARDLAIPLEEMGYLFLPKQPAEETQLPNGVQQIDVPLILQTDPAWANKEYGPGADEHLGKTGCAIATLAMIEATYGNNQTSPHDILAWSKDTYYIPEIGTDWTIFEAFAKKYNYDFHNYGSNFHAAMEAIKEDRLIVASVDPGFFTDVGHILIIRGYDPDNHLVYVNDPNDDPTKMYSIQGIDEQVFLDEGLNYWSFGK